jgi:hypothetical protein
MDAGATAAISGLTISGGSAGQGGRIDNLGSLTVGGSTLSDNSASIYGGGIHNRSSLTINATGSCTVGATRLCPRYSRTQAIQVPYISLPMSRYVMIRPCLDIVCRFQLHRQRSGFRLAPRKADRANYEFRGNPEEAACPCSEN